jgi:hypothetical protein
MKCRFSENDIALYVGGDLASAQAFEIETHLLACDACRALATELGESYSGLKSLRQDTVGTAALSAVRARVLAQISNRTARTLWARWVYAVAGGVFVALMAVGVSYIPLLREREVAAPSSKSSLPLNSLAGVVGPESDNRLLEPTTPSAPAKVASRRSINGRSHPSLAKEGNKNGPNSEEPKTVMVKLLTDDPNVVIYWLVDQTGGTL